MVAAQESVRSLPVLAPTPAPAAGSIAAFATQENFVAAQRMAAALSASSLVPKEYQGNVANCLIAMELASRMGASVFMVMQHLNIIHGRPSFSAQFVIGTANACGRFTPLRFEWSKAKTDSDEYGCRAVAIDKASGEVCEGAWVTWSMVKAEGWLSKAGSKWKTMAGQMFMYRAASYWVKVYAPELLMGMHTAEEVRDIVTVSEVPVVLEQAPATTPAEAPKRPVLEVPAGMSGLEKALAVQDAANAEPKSNSPADIGFAKSDDADKGVGD